MIQKKPINSRRICGGCLGLYGLLMLWLMFLQRTPAPGDYWDTVAASYNLIPFQTLSAMGALLSGRPELARFAVINLLGNVVMFLPLGLLPAVWEKQRKFGVFLLTVTVLIVVLELIQLFTTLGSADVDDLLLNVPGACIGYAICVFFQKKRNLGAISPSLSVEDKEEAP